MLGLAVRQKPPLVPLRDVVIVPVFFSHSSNMDISIEQVQVQREARKPLVPVDCIRIVMIVDPMSAIFAELPFSFNMT